MESYAYHMDMEFFGFDDEQKLLDEDYIAQPSTQTQVWEDLDQQSRKIDWWDSAVRIIAVRCEAPISSYERKTQKRASFPFETKDIMNRWLSSHSDYPYPTSSDLDTLIQQTKLTKKQVMTYMINMRARFLKRRNPNH